MNKINKTFINRILKLIAFALVFWGIHLSLNYCILSATDDMRIQAHDLDKQSYDIIAFGQSNCLNSFDTKVISDKLGVSAFNYGVRSASLFGGIRGAMDNAFCKQHPSKVFFIMPMDDLKAFDGQEPLEVYNRSAIFYTDTTSAIKYYTRVSMEGGAINRLFPWKNMLSAVPDENYKKWIIDTVTKKQSMGYKNFDPDWYNANKSNERYIENGFLTWSADHIMTYNNVYNLRARYLGEWRDEVPELNHQEIDSLIFLMRRCMAKGMEVYFVAAPQPFSEINSNQYYKFQTEYLRELVESIGAHYYDLNLMKADYYRADEEDWADTNHLNERGAIRWTETLCNLILTEGDSDSAHQDLFYDNWDDFLQSMNDIYGVGITIRYMDDNEALVGFAITSPENKLEYAFTCYDGDDTSTEIILRDYETTNYIYTDDCSELIDAAGIQNPTFRCYARLIGNEASVRYGGYDL